MDCIARATVSVEDFNIIAVHLSVTGNVPGISAEEFEAITKAAEQHCLVFKELKISVSSEARLVLS